MGNKTLIIIGASARAAACSAYRAGYAPYWLDRFGDTDLCERFPGRVARDYPHDLADLLRAAPDAPFMYTGALENYPELLQTLGRQRPLLGNPGPVCRRARDPSRLSRALQQRGLPCPETRPGGREQTVPAPDGRRTRTAAARKQWLLKPLHGGGGMGIRRYAGEATAASHYLQEYLDGESYAAVFLAGRGYCQLLGVTLQLVGAPTFCAAPFSYCGSIGPLAQSEPEARQWRHIGETLSRALGLRGLFGVDAIKRQDGIYPVELNPRYTASVEVIELALGCRAVRLHCDTCNDRSPKPVRPRAQRVFGKAIVFAPRDLSFRPGIDAGCASADLPASGARIRQGQPIQTLLVSGTEVEAVNRQLEQAAGRVLAKLCRDP